MTLSRRYFLLALAAGSSAACSGQLGGLFLNEQQRVKRELERMNLPDQSALIIGMSYLQNTPTEQSVDQLLAGLETTRAQDWQAHVRLDYAADRTFSVDGWIVSRTEGRLCALHALLFAI